MPMGKRVGKVVSVNATDPVYVAFTGTYEFRATLGGPYKAIAAITF